MTGILHAVAGTSVGLALVVLFLYFLHHFLSAVWPTYHLLRGPKHGSSGT